MTEFEDTKADRVRKFQKKSRGKNRPLDYWERDTNDKVFYRRVKINLRGLEGLDDGEA